MSLACVLLRTVHPKRHAYQRIRGQEEWAQAAGVGLAVDHGVVMAPHKGLKKANEALSFGQ